MSTSSFTKAYHRSSYPAISTDRPELSTAGKTVIITGAGYHDIISAPAADAFAAAGATRIALIGLNSATLEKDKASLEENHPGLKVHYEVVEITDPESVGKAAHQIRAQFGAWDVFLHCASFVPERARLTGSDFDDWWTGFEVNVKFIHHFAKHFMTKCRPGSSFICLSSQSVHTSATPGAFPSSYSASKLAALKLTEFLAVQYPMLRVFNFHPGIIDTLLAQKSGTSQEQEIEKSDFDLASNFMVWLASPESEFLRGRFVSANWDVEELEAKKELFENDATLLRPTLGGWPFEYPTS